MDHVDVVGHVFTGTTVQKLYSAHAVASPSKRTTLVKRTKILGLLLDKTQLRSRILLMFCDLLIVTRSMSSMLFASHSSFLQHVNCHKSVYLAVKPIPLRTFAVLRILHILYISRYIFTQFYTWIWFNSLVTFLWQMITSKQYLNTQVSKNTIFTRASQHTLKCVLGPLHQNTS